MNARNISSLFRFGVRQKVLMVLISVLFTGLTASGWMSLKQEEHNTFKEINRRGSDISRFVAKSLSFSVVGYDYHTLQLLLDDITNSEDIGFAEVLNIKGRIMAQSGHKPTEDSLKMAIFNQDIRLGEELVGNLKLGLSATHTLNRLESQK